jgi:hypothetical protein
MIARTTHQAPPPGPGETALNRLLHTDLALASELLLARARLTHAAAHSDPDLPRLWIAANALHHGVPAQVVLSEPATSHGPLARVVPRHHDLVGWHGITAALDQLDATVHAIRDGRAWITSAGDTAHNRLLGLGVIHLSHPRTAHQLTRDGAAGIHQAVLRRLASTLPTPRHVTDLSDTAVKAVCDRNHWLLGTAEERTNRELVERHVLGALTDQIRASLAAGDTQALAEAITRAAPTDHHLDRATWRHDPPALDAEQRHQLLDIASREALHRFAGLDLQPHPTKAAALLGRFPDRIAEQGLHVQPGQLHTPHDAQPVPVPPAHLAQQFELDLGPGT